MIRIITSITHRQLASFASKNLVEQNPIPIVIADDHAVLRESLTALLQSQPDFEVVGAAANSSQRQANATLMILTGWLRFTRSDEVKLRGRVLG